MDKEFVYYLPEENKISIVNPFNHKQFVAFVLEKFGVEDFAAGLQQYPDIIFLGEL